MNPRYLTKNPNHFVDRFIEFHSTYRDIPPDYLLGCSLALLSMVGEKIRIKHPIFPRGQGVNMYFMMLGPPAISRKSAAMKVLRQFLEDVSGTFHHRIARDTFTSIALLDKMADTPHGPFMLLNDELSMLMTGIKHDVNKQVIGGIMLSMHDSRNFTHTRAKKMQKGGRVSDTIEVRDVCLNVFGAGTDAIMSDLSKYDIISGQISRFIILTPDDQPSPMNLSESAAGHVDIEQLTSLVGTLKHIHVSFRQEVEATLTPGAWDALQKHQDKINRWISKNQTDIIAAAIGRFGLTHPLRMSALVALGAASDAEISEIGRTSKMTVTREHALTAMRWCRRWEINTKDFAIRIEGSAYSRQAYELYKELVKKHGVGTKVRRTEISQSRRISKFDMDQIEGTLMTWGCIKPTILKGATDQGRDSPGWELLTADFQGLRQAQDPTLSYIRTPVPDYEDDESTLPGSAEPF